MPRKEFQAFTRLDASDVNSFLMDQSVMTFASSAARASAIPTPVEGMVTFLEDTKLTEQYANGAWKVLTPSSGNAIINGAFEINQRNFTSTTTSNLYGLDRWNVLSEDGNFTYSVQQFTLGAAPVAGQEARQHARVVVSGQTLASARTLLRQPVEDVRTFAGQNVILSFWAKAASGTPFIAAAITQLFGSGGSPSAAVITSSTKKQIGTTWNRYTFTFSIPSISGKVLGTNNDSRLSAEIWFSGGSDRNAITDSLGIQSNTFDIWGVQLEAGSVATPFRRNANSIQGELAACQRYFFRGGPGAQGMAVLSTLADLIISYPVPMRAAPSVSHVANYNILEVNVANRTVTALGSFSGGTLACNLGVTVGGGGMTPPNRVQISGSTGANLDFSAEL